MFETELALPGTSQTAALVGEEDILNRPPELPTGGESLPEIENLPENSSTEVVLPTTSELLPELPKLESKEPVQNDPLTGLYTTSLETTGLETTAFTEDPLLNPTAGLETTDLETTDLETTAGLEKTDLETTDLETTADIAETTPRETTTHTTTKRPPTVAKPRVPWWEEFPQGVFTVTNTNGEVKIDFLFDGSNRKGEVAIFSLEGMERIKAGSAAFIKEAAQRALSNSTLGHVVISDKEYGARFNGLIEEENYNEGTYEGVKTVYMTPGAKFGMMLLPSGSIEHLTQEIDTTHPPLFSMAYANPKREDYLARIGTEIGNGNVFGFSDQLIETEADFHCVDFNDVIFQVRGAVSMQVPSIDEVINPENEWRYTIQGQELVKYADVSVQTLGGGSVSTIPDSVKGAIESKQDLTTFDPAQLEITKDWVFQLHPSIDPEQFAALLGAISWEKNEFLENTYVFTFPAELTPQELQKQMMDLPISEFAYPNVGFNIKPTPVISPSYPGKELVDGLDPLVNEQWHLTAANITPELLSTANGSGVTIGIVDGGIDVNQIDLQAQQSNIPSWTVTGAPVPSTPTEPTIVHKEDLFSRVTRPTGSSYGFRWWTDVNFVSGSDNPDPLMHGTSVAGIIVSGANNSEGGIGVAPAAEFASVQLASGPVTEKEIAKALAYENDEIAIYNNSWKPQGGLFSSPMILSAIEKGATHGRDGLGNIYIFAGGNDGEVGGNVNYNGLANSRFAIAVGAASPEIDPTTNAFVLDSNGRIVLKETSYSEPGASILISAPSNSPQVGITTTDITGEKGYNAGEENSNDVYKANGDFSDGNYTNKFGGTSAAAPIVSGVVALMLDVNPNLSRRDVEHILVETAYQNDPTDADWSTNDAGYNVNHKFGFGVVDATAAVTMAQNWLPVAPEVSISSGVMPVNQTIPEYDSVSLLGQEAVDVINKFEWGTNPVLTPDEEQILLNLNPPANPNVLNSTIAITQDIVVEKVEVVFNATHTARGDLKVVLVSPDGTESVLADRHQDSDDNYNNWVFTSVRNWGESSVGNWTLRVSDEWGNEVGTWNSWKLNIYGTEKPTVTISVQDSSAAEDGNSGAFLVSRSGGNLNEDLVVNYALAGDAVAGADYLGLTGSVVIPAGQSSVVLPVVPLADGVVDGDKSVVVNLLAGDVYQLGSVVSDQLTITDESELSLLYREVHGRDADAGGLAFWTNGLNSGMSVADVRSGMVYDPSNLESRDKINQMYLDVLGRVPSASEMSAAQARLAVDTSLSQLRQELQSPGVPVVQTTNTVYINPANGRRYVLTRPDSWLGAQAQAEALGGDLVTINDASEQAWLLQTFGSDESLWVGLTDSPIYGSSEGNFGWVNGEPVVYTNWHPTAPAGNGDFVHINDDLTNFPVDGVWNDASVAGFLSGIVELADTRNLLKIIL